MSALSAVSAKSISFILIKYKGNTLIVTVTDINVTLKVWKICNIRRFSSFLIMLSVMNPAELRKDRPQSVIAIISQTSPKYVLLCQFFTCVGCVILWEIFWDKPWPRESHWGGHTLQSQWRQGDLYQTVDRLYNSHLSRLQTVIYQILIISRLVFMSLSSLSVTFTSQLLEAAIALSPLPFFILIYYIISYLACLYIVRSTSQCINMSTTHTGLT